MTLRKPDLMSKLAESGSITALLHVRKREAMETGEDASRSMQVHAWWFEPLYGKDSVNGPPEIVYATSLDQAFVQARRSWPTAQGWRCLGTVNPKNSEKSTKRDAGWTERVVRTREETP